MLTAQRAALPGNQLLNIERIEADLWQAADQLLGPLDRWTEKEQTQAIVQVHVLDELFKLLPSPPYSDEDKAQSALRVYEHLWQTSAGGPDPRQAA